MLEARPHRYKASISDLAGAAIWSAFTDFMAQNFDALVELGFSAQDVERLPVGELIEQMQAWVSARAAR